MGVCAGVFVVTGVKKSLLNKALFHLVALDDDHFWCKLQRGDKNGVAFR